MRDFSAHKTSQYDNISPSSQYMVDIVTDCCLLYFLSSKGYGGGILILNQNHTENINTTCTCDGEAGGLRVPGEPGLCGKTLSQKIK
jgi:hypothetical protein